MATKKYISENSTVNNIDISYMGDITYKKSHQTFSSGEQFNLKYVTQDPVDYIIAKDVFSVLTKPEFYSETFDNIREEKQGTGVSDYQLSALAQNDYFGSESLSAVAETETGEYAIAISDIVSDNNFSDLVVYSFSSKVSYAGSSGFYWKYQSDTLNYELSPENFTDDNYFYFNFIDGQYCNIIKNLSGGSKYLTYDTGLSSLIFQTD
jgi:hypothetical protein